MAIGFDRVEGGVVIDLGGGDRSQQTERTGAGAIAEPRRTDHPKELPIPPAAVGDEQAVEIVRAWIADGDQWVTIDPHRYQHRDFDEEWAWGLFLADTARHLADAIAEQTGKDRDQVLEAIRRSLQEELAAPTSEAQGGFIDGSTESSP